MCMRRRRRSRGYGRRRYATRRVTRRRGGTRVRRLRPFAGRVGYRL